MFTELALLIIAVPLIVLLARYVYQVRWARVVSNSSGIVVETSDGTRSTVEGTVGSNVGCKYVIGSGVMVMRTTQTSCVIMSVAIPIALATTAVAVVMVAMIKSALFLRVPLAQG
jgi:hypothetical protein